MLLPGLHNLSSNFAVDYVQGISIEPDCLGFLDTKLTTIRGNPDSVSADSVCTLHIRLVVSTAIVRLFSWVPSLG